MCQISTYHWIGVVGHLAFMSCWPCKTFINVDFSGGVLLSHNVLKAFFRLPRIDSRWKSCLFLCHKRKKKRKKKKSGLQKEAQRAGNQQSEMSLSMMQEKSCCSSHVVTRSRKHNKNVGSTETWCISQRSASSSAALRFTTLPKLLSVHIPFLFPLYYIHRSSFWDKNPSDLMIQNHPQASSLEKYQYLPSKSRSNHTVYRNR